MLKKTLRSVPVTIFTVAIMAAAVFAAAQFNVSQPYAALETVSAQSEDREKPETSEGSESQSDEMQIMPLSQDGQECRQPEETAARHMDRLASISEKQMELFTTISERVDEFYRAEATVAEEYDQYFDDVETAEDQAGSAVEDLRERRESFECGGENLSQHAGQFRDRFSETRTYLKELRQAVREQIRLVKDDLLDESGSGEESSNGTESSDGEE